MKDRNGDDFDLFDLDIHRLEEAWVEHVRFHRHYAAKLPPARRAREEARAEEKVSQVELKEVTAATELEIRKSHTAFGLDKLTEGGVEKCAILQPQVKKAQEAVFKARREAIVAEEKVDVLEVMLSSLDHRKKALENLVFLQGRDYYAQPKMKTDRQRMEETRARYAHEDRRQDDG